MKFVRKFSHKKGAVLRGENFFDETEVVLYKNDRGGQFKLIYRKGNISEIKTVFVHALSIKYLENIFKVLSHPLFLDYKIENLSELVYLASIIVENKSMVREIKDKKQAEFFSEKSVLVFAKREDVNIIKAELFFQKVKNKQIV